jgi:hypothetical protein
MFLGFYHDSEIPFKAGQVVTLPKGTLVQTRLGLVENKRARRVKIDRILNGMSICVGHVYGGGTRVSFQFGYESDIRRCKEIYGTEDLTQLWPLMRVINGSIFLPFSNPVIRWAGSGGYWCDADINQLA